MTAKTMTDYWCKGAEEDLITAETLFSTKRYLPCLFFCHLIVEKIIKAHIVKLTGETAPYGHKLTRLAALTTTRFTKEQLDLLDDLTAFNIKARYEDYKYRMSQKADKEYTLKYLQKTKEIYLWLKKQL